MHLSPSLLSLLPACSRPGHPLPPPVTTPKTSLQDWWEVRKPQPGPPAGRSHTDLPWVGRSRSTPGALKKRRCFDYPNGTETFKLLSLTTTTWAAATDVATRRPWPCSSGVRACCSKPALGSRGVGGGPWPPPSLWEPQRVSFPAPVFV